MPIQTVTINSASFDTVTDVFTFNVTWTGTGAYNNQANLDLRVDYTTPEGGTGFVTVRQLFASTAAAPFNAVNGTGQTITATNANIVPASGNLAELQNLPIGTTFDITPTYNLLATGNQPSVQDNTVTLTVLCFMPGTLIATPGGEVAIETLQAGDLVLTAEGKAAPVRWIGRQTVSARFAPHNLPIRLAAGSLGEGLPKRDLLVSPAHALLVDGILVNAAALVNGTTIRQERDVPAVFTYYNIELAEHAVLLAEGAPAESFVDNVSREAFDNSAEHEAVGGGAIAELLLPRAASARQVPVATRARLAAVAATLTGTARQAA